MKTFFKNVYSRATYNCENGKQSKYLSAQWNSMHLFKMIRVSVTEVEIKS